MSKYPFFYDNDDNQVFVEENNILELYKVVDYLNDILKYLVVKKEDQDDEYGEKYFLNKDYFEALEDKYNLSVEVVNEIPYKFSGGGMLPLGADMGKDNRLIIFDINNYSLFIEKDILDKNKEYILSQKENIDSNEIQYYINKEVYDFIKSEYKL